MITDGVLGHLNIVSKKNRFVAIAIVGVIILLIELFDWLEKMV